MARSRVSLIRHAPPLAARLRRLAATARAIARRGAVRQGAVTLGLLAVVFASGQVMEHGRAGQAAAAALPVARPAPVRAVRPAPAARIAALPRAAAPRLSADPVAPALPADSRAPSFTLAAFGPSAPEAAACAPARLEVAAAEAGVLLLALEAPCHPGQTARIAHSGVEIAVSLDAAGRWVGGMPALAAPAILRAQLPDGQSLTAQAAQATAPDGEVVALLWSGPAALHLNVFENGADYGTAGHVSVFQPRHPGAGEGGYLVALGAGPGRAELYLAPASPTALRIDLEAEVTAQTCGRDLSARVLRGRGGQLAATPVTLSMPGCDAIGDVVLLPLPGSQR